MKLIGSDASKSSIDGDNNTIRDFWTFNIWSENGW